MTGRQVRPRSPTRSLRRLAALARAERRTLLAIGIGLVLGITGTLAVGRPAAPSAFSRMARVRVAAVNAQIEQVAGDHLLLVGDSHVERLFLPVLCGLPTISLGLGGATAADLRQATSGLSPATPPRAIVLSVGTNDLLGEAATHKAGLDTFEADLGALVQRLRALSPRIVVTDIPTIRPEKPVVQPGASLAYSEAVARTCARAGCEVAPLFAAAQANGRPLAFKKDGVHLADYGALYRDLATRLCPS